jgi:hypothetical protein
MRWEERSAESLRGSRCPRTYCRWHYDLAGGDDTIRTGIGAAGITFYGLLWAAAANDDVATIANLAATAETLAVTFYYAAITGAKFDVDSADVAYLKLAMDAERLTLAFENLLMNALQHSPSGARRRTRSSAGSGSRGRWSPSAGSSRSAARRWRTGSRTCRTSGSRSRSPGARPTCSRDAGCRRACRAA